MFSLLVSGCASGNEVPDMEVNSEAETKKMETKKDPSLIINSGGKEIVLKDLAPEYSGAILKTNFGDIKVKLYGEDSPLTVNNFLNLAQDGFYDNTKFHRVIKDFMIQGGDPNSKDDDWTNDGMGGPDYKFKDEINSHKLVRGSLAMANSGPNTNGSQFFIVTVASTPWLDGKHTNFGYVQEGMDIVEKIEAVEVNENNHPTEDVVVENIELVK
jgi:peptidyl-prolyl cis-trans isomerase B (cyclophilin B)